MLKGIDISNHQGKDGINVDAVLPNVDFVITKATEGTNFTDTYCDKFVQATIKAGKLFGFYHFANKNDPISECNFFLDQTVGYRGIGIPILDWEGVYNNKGEKIYEQSVDWVNKFVRHYHAKTGCYPWIYANPWRFNQGGVESNCGRWIASYPNVRHPNLDYDPGNIPKTEGLVCCWQYASDGRVPGYNGNLDLNHFYGDANGWNAYAKAGLSSDSNNNSADKVAISVLENDEYKVTIERR